MATTNTIKNIFQESITIRDNILSDNLFIANIAKLAKTAINTIKNGNTIILAGNGGSFADAQHITAELVGRFLTDRDALPAFCLGTNSSNITSISNDYSFSDIFLRELSALGRDGDLFIPISTSGNSNNLIKALTVAYKKNIKIFCLLGKGGGFLAKYNNITVPSNNTARIQEIHITIGHILCELIDMELS